MTSAQPHSPGSSPSPWASLFKAFPLILFLCSAFIFFALENKMDAPLTSLDDRVIADVAQQVSDGDAYHKVLTVILGGLGAFYWFRYRHRIQIHGIISAVFIAYLGWVCLGALFADDPALTIRRVGGFSLSLLLCMGCAARMNVDANSIFVAGVPILTLVPDIVAELSCHGLQALAPGGRFGGTYPHPNVAGAALAVPVVVCTWLMFRTSGVLRSGIIGINGVVLTFFLLTRSRTAIIAVLAALLFSFAIFMLRSQRRRMARLMGATALIFGLIGLSALVANSSPQGVDLLSALHNERDEGDPTTLTGRVDLWKTCLQYAYERPVLGFGFSGFWSAKHIETISQEQQWPINQSHSAYLDQVLALGFPGAALHVMIIFGCLIVCTVRYFRHHDEFGVWAALLVFIAVHSLTEAISLAPGFLNFCLTLIATQISFIRPGIWAPQPVHLTDRAIPRLPNTPSVHKYPSEEYLHRALASIRKQRS